jgi:hypothetical protein
MRHLLKVASVVAQTGNQSTPFPFLSFTLLVLPLSRVYCISLVVRQTPFRPFLVVASEPAPFTIDPNIVSF